MSHPACAKSLNIYIFVRNWSRGAVFRGFWVILCANALGRGKNLFGLLLDMGNFVGQYCLEEGNILDSKYKYCKSGESGGHYPTFLVSAYPKFVAVSTQILPL